MNSVEMNLATKAYKQLCEGVGSITGCDLIYYEGMWMIKLTKWYEDKQWSFDCILSDDTSEWSVKVFQRETIFEDYGSVVYRITTPYDELLDCVTHTMYCKK